MIVFLVLQVHSCKQLALPAYPIVLLPLPLAGPELPHLHHDRL
jgi:hypothetical protein